jgi:hypothetical protein
MLDDENTLIKIFKDKFIHQNDIGNEYFKRDINLMIKIINTYFDDKIDINKT